MKLSEVIPLNEAQGQTLFHLTTMKAAISILKSGTFNLKKIPRSRPPRFVMSTARSQSSDFFDMMGGSGSVVLMLSRPQFESSYQIKPYVCPDAADEFGSEWDEQEEQIQYTQPVLPIPQPINRSIFRIVFTPGKTDPRAEMHYDENMLQQLNQICTSLQIPIRMRGNGYMDGQERLDAWKEKKRQQVQLSR